MSLVLAVPEGSKLIQIIERFHKFYETFSIAENFLATVNFFDTPCVSRVTK